MRETIRTASGPLNRATICAHCPPTLLLIKWLLRRIPFEVCRTAALDALEARSAGEVDAVLKKHAAAYVDIHLLDPHGPLPARGGVAI